MSAVRRLDRHVLRDLFSRPASVPGPSPASLDLPGPRRFGTVQLRHVDVGSCNGCEMEIAQAFGPVYDAAQYGARLVASPRHADGLLVTGTPTLNMRQPLQRVREAVPQPALVVACGDCALGRGPYAEAYAVTGGVREHGPVHAEIVGCPPHPEEIVRVLRQVTGR